MVLLGTDTGVGKTTIAAGLVAYLVGRGLRVAPFKPIETGCEPTTEGGLLPADGSRLLAAAGADSGLTLDQVCPLRFARPVTPWVAARDTGRPIERGDVDQAYAELAASHEFVVVESCGGLLSPIGDGLDSLTLASFLALPVLLVARSSLGTINHTLLALRAVRQAGLRCLGVVLSRTRQDVTPDEATNAEVIERFANVDVLGVAPFSPDTHPPDDLFDAVCTRLRGVL